MYIKVMFRKWPNGDIIALFPEVPGTSDPYTCSSYEHHGQHSSADRELCIQGTKPASPAEYADLKRELEGCGYVLLILQRGARSHLEVRRKGIKG